MNTIEWILFEMNTIEWIFLQVQMHPRQKNGRLGFIESELIINATLPTPPSIDLSGISFSQK